MWSWIMFFLFILGFVIAWKIFKKVMKAFMVVSVIFLIVTGIIGFFMILQMSEFKEKFPRSQKLFLLEEQGKIISGTSVGELDFSQESPKGLTEEELIRLNEEYNGVPENILGDHYIIFIMSPQFLKEGMPETLVLNGEQTVTSAELLSSIRSETPSDLLLKDTPEDYKENVRAAMLVEVSEEDLRASYLMLAFSSIINEKGVMFIIDQLKEENLVIYPEFMVFRVVEQTPGFVLERMIGE